VKKRHPGLIFKGQLSILLRLTEFVLNRNLSKLSSKTVPKYPHPGHGYPRTGRGESNGRAHYGLTYRIG
jgi:hypothetical protein